MSTQDDELLASLNAIFAEVKNGNLRARVTLADDAPASFKSLADGINTLILGWRNSELEARKTKRDLEAKLVMIERNAAIAIRDLSTPVMQVWEGVLLLPIVGVFDENRSREMTEELLQHLARTQSRYVIIDITGVDEVDTQTADNLVRMARSAKLIGARSVVTGVSPSVAQTLTSIGSDLNQLATRRTLAQGLMTCIRSSGDDIG